MTKQFFLSCLDLKSFLFWSAASFSALEQKEKEGKHLKTTIEMPDFCKMNDSIWVFVKTLDLETLHYVTGKKTCLIYHIVLFIFSAIVKSKFFQMLKR